MWKNFLLLISSLFFCVLIILIVLEVWLRFYYKKPETLSVEKIVCQYDDLLGWRGKPNVRVQGMFEGGDIFSINHNSNGYRDTEHTYEKPEGVKRIAVLGDSFTWGFNVKVEDTFPKILEKKLGTGYEILSFGIPGYSTDQELIVLEKEALKYKPDVVILDLFLDDIFFNGRMSRDIYEKPYFVKENSVLIMKNVPVPYLKSPFYSIEFIKKRIYMFRNLLTIPSEFRKDTWKNIMNSRYLSSSDWQITFDIIQKMNYTCTENKAKFFVIVTPVKNQINSPWRLPQDVLLNFGRQTGIPVLDFLPAFGNYTSGLYFDNDLHWAKNGHAVAADVIYDFMLKRNIHQQKEK